MTTTLTPERIADLRALIVRAYTEIGEVCAQGVLKRFKMSVPADPDRDTDLIITHALNGAEELLTEVETLRTKLDAPCGSCHPCTNWADETWRQAGRKPPHVHEYDELRAEVETLRALHEDQIMPDMWAVVTPDDKTMPRSLVFAQGTRKVEIQLSDYLAASLGLLPDTRQQPVIDPDCQDGKCGSCIGGPYQHDCHQAASGE